MIGQAEDAAARARRQRLAGLRDGIFAEPPTKDAAVQADAADIDTANSRSHADTQTASQGIAPSSDADRLLPVPAQDQAAAVLLSERLDLQSCLPHQCQHQVKPNLRCHLAQLLILPSRQSQPNRQVAQLGAASLVSGPDDFDFLIAPAWSGRMPVEGCCQI